MIKLKISMADGKTYRIRNLQCNTIYDFITLVLMKGGTELIWYEVLPTQFIRVSNIAGIEKIEEEFTDKFEDEILEESEEIEQMAEKVELGEISQEPLDSNNEE